MIPEEAMPVVEAIRKHNNGVGRRPSERACTFWWGVYAGQCSTLACNTFANWLQDEGFPAVSKELFPVEVDDGNGARVYSLEKHRRCD